MSLLSKTAILAADDLRHEDVPVPAWGGSVRVRVMTGQARDEYREFIASHEGKAQVGFYAATLVSVACIDENGARLFSLDDVEQLRQKCAAAVDIVANAAMRLNGLGGSAVEDAEKNSGSDQSGDSGSALPKN